MTTDATEQTSPKPLFQWQQKSCANPASPLWLLSLSNVDLPTWLVLARVQWINFVTNLISTVLPHPGLPSSHIVLR